MAKRGTVIILSQPNQPGRMQLFRAILLVAAALGVFRPAGAAQAVFASGLIFPVVIRIYVLDLF
jgi:hypothetical protein